MVVVVCLVAVMMDGFAGDVADEPYEMPAAVIVADVDAEAHISEYIGCGHQQAEEGSGDAFHPCKNKD